MAIVNGAIGKRPAIITQLAEVQVETAQIHHAYLQQQAQGARLTTSGEQEFRAAVTISCRQEE